MEELVYRYPDMPKIFTDFIPIFVQLGAGLYEYIFENLFAVP
jgi:hypothetical protein